MFTRFTRGVAASGLLAAFVLPTAALADVIVSVPIVVGSTASGLCSPCSPGPDFADARAWSTFTTTAPAILDGAKLQGFFAAGSDPGPVEVSIWDSPFGNTLYARTFDVADFEVTPGGLGEMREITFDLPGWVLTAGTWSVSFFGVEGTLLAWGVETDAAAGSFPAGNGSSYSLIGAPTPLFENVKLGYELTGRIVPEPGTWALMIAGLGVTGFALRRGRAAARLPAA
jgi:hypothetical protein